MRDGETKTMWDGLSVGEPAQPRSLERHGSVIVRPNPAVMSTMKKHTAVQHVGEKRYEVRLKIDHQTFTLAGRYNRDTAYWFRWQLAQAVHRLLSSPNSVSATSRGKEEREGA